MKLADFFYALSCLSFGIILGGAVYEHIVLWPSAFADLPRSLAVFQGEFGLVAANFWIPVHPVTLGLFVVTFWIHRRTARRTWVLLPFAAYGLVLLATFAFFVPELTSLVGMPFADSSDAAATARARTWEVLSLVRLAVLVVAALGLFLGLTRSSSHPAQRAR